MKDCRETAKRRAEKSAILKLPSQTIATGGFVPSAMPALVWVRRIDVFWRTEGMNQESDDIVASDERCDCYWRSEMSVRVLIVCASALLIFFSGVASAQEQDGLLEMRRLQALLSVINSEIKADLDQVMALREAIAANSLVPLNLPGRSAAPASYNDVVAAQERAMQRDTILNARLDAVMTRNSALDAEKQPLLERVRELGGLRRSGTVGLSASPLN